MDNMTHWLRPGVPYIDDPSDYRTTQLLLLQVVSVTAILESITNLEHDLVIT